MKAVDGVPNHMTDTAFWHPVTAMGAVRDAEFVIRRGEVDRTGRRSLLIYEDRAAAVGRAHRTDLRLDRPAPPHGLAR